MEVRVKEINVAGDTFDIVITSSEYAGSCAISVYRGHELVEFMECSVPEKVDRREAFFDLLVARVPFLLRKLAFMKRASDRADQPA